MKVLITEDFYSNYELYETEDISELKDYVSLMANGKSAELDETRHILVGSQDDIDTETAIKEADEIIYISDFEGEHI